MAGSAQGVSSARRGEYTGGRSPVDVGRRAPLALSKNARPLMENLDPLVCAPAEPAVKSDAPSAQQPAPTAEQQQVADGVFTKQQEQLASAALGLSAGLGILHHLAVETFGGKKDEEEETPPAPPRKDEEQPR